MGHKNVVHRVRASNAPETLNSLGAAGEIYNYTAFERSGLATRRAEATLRLCYREMFINARLLTDTLNRKKNLSIPRLRFDGDTEPVKLTLTLNFKIKNFLSIVLYSSRR